jgi:hypothetical protein
MRLIHTHACRSRVDALAFALLDEKQRMVGRNTRVPYVALEVDDDRECIRLTANGNRGRRINVGGPTWRGVRTFDNADDAAEMIFLAYPDISFSVGTSPLPIRIMYTNVMTWQPSSSYGLLFKDLVQSCMLDRPSTPDELLSAAKTGLECILGEDERDARAAHTNFPAFSRILQRGLD